MTGINDIMKENCRTCLSYFSESNRKCSLMNCLPLTSDSDRLQLMKNIMNTCSLTLFSSNKENEDFETFICMSCLIEMDKMLNFLQKCIRSEAILKKASEVKTESSKFLVDVQDRSENSVQPKVEIKVEGYSQDSNEFDDNSFPVFDLENKNNNGNKKLECQECHKMFPSALSLTYHRYKHAGYKLHTCIICHEKFRTLQLIKKHMAAEHSNQLYQCRQCLEMFNSKYHLNQHKRKIHSAKKYICNVCKRTFSTISSLKFHENIHLRQQSHLCNSCSKSFSSVTILRDHEASVHSEIKQFECHCGRSFNRKRKLELHVESVHEKKDKLRKYECLECDKKFHHPYLLKNHLNTHLGVKPFLCNACGSAFTALSNLTSHFRRIHSGDKQPSIKKYLCHTCGDSFSRASHLQRHTLRKHVPNAEKKHECPICNKKFLEKSDVTGHLKLHDDVKPFVCDQCSKCFRTAWRLRAHVKRVHLGLRPFECPTCSDKFKTKSHLEKHIRTHTGEKPFPCPHCAYTCAEKSNLKKHINIHLKAT